MNHKMIKHIGADITDYFNYGFNEDTWRLYCQKQVQFRLEQSMQSRIKVFQSDDAEGASNNQNSSNIPSSQSSTPNTLKRVKDEGNSGGMGMGIPIATNVDDSDAVAINLSHKFSPFDKSMYSFPLFYFSFV